MQNEETSKHVMSGMMWAFGERIGAQIVTLSVSIVLARLLSPEEYTIVAIVTIFITIANVFVSGGFGNALIQKLHADELDFSTTFCFSLAVSVAIYITLFFAAPIISDFYNLPVLILVIRIMSLRIIIAAFNTVQQAYVSRMLAFRKFFFSTLSGTIVSAVIGIGAAYYGLGVWALVAQYLTNVTIDTIVLSFTCGWRPRAMFSFERMGSLFSYGWKVLLTDLIATLYEQMRGLVLSKTISTTSLAYYNQGEKFPALFINNIETSIHKVLMPVVAKAQQDRDRVLDLTRKSLSMSVFAIFPLLTGLAVIGEPLIHLLYTQKWLPCVPYMQLICITYLMTPIIETHTRTMKALGRSDLLVKMTMVRYVIGSVLLVMFVVLFHDGLLIITSWTLSMVVAVVLCGSINRRLIGYKFRYQVQDIFGTAASSGVMCAAAYSIKFLELSLFATLGMQIMIGALVYVMVSLVFNRTILKFTVHLVAAYIPAIRRTKRNL